MTNSQSIYASNIHVISIVRLLLGKICGTECFTRDILPSGGQK
jgi:hypothetical protein